MNERLGRRKCRARHFRPESECLEGRKLLYAATGNLWSLPQRVTYSFAPDGTSIGGVSSSLFQSMTNRGYSAATWEAQFQKAAAVWEAVANVNLVPVSDDGSSFGASGYQQGDTRFGDIRIGGTGLAAGTLAQTFLPPPANGGTLAGDIVMSTNVAWKINSDFDIQTVAIHEIGHALGMDHSAISTADMYAYYNNIKQSLTSDDSSGLASIYSTRAADAFDANGSNNTFATADNVSSYLNGSAQAALANLDIGSATDYDYFYVVAPAGTSGTLSVTMQSTNLSSLSPRLAIFNSSQTTLASALATNVYGATVTATVSGVTAGQGFYIRAMAANTGAGSAGAYGLSINFGVGTMPAFQPPNTQVASQPDQGGGSLGLGAGDLSSAPFGSAKGLGHDAEAETIRIGSLSGSGDSLTVRPRSSTHRHGHVTLTSLKHGARTAHPVPTVGRAFSARRSGGSHQVS